jgi:hypothetical protein
MLKPSSDTDRREGQVHAVRSAASREAVQARRRAPVEGRPRAQRVESAGPRRGTNITRSVHQDDPRGESVAPAGCPPLSWGRASNACFRATLRRGAAYCVRSRLYNVCSVPARVGSVRPPCSAQRITRGAGTLPSRVVPRATVVGSPRACARGGLFLLLWMALGVATILMALTRAKGGGLASRTRSLPAHSRRHGARRWRRRATRGRLRPLYTVSRVFGMERASW